MILNDNKILTMLMKGKGFEHKGEFDATAIYYNSNTIIDCVSYSGASYYCKKTTTAGILPTNAEYWGILATSDTSEPTVDSTLSTTSENAVQNKVVTNEINKKAETDGSNVNSTSFKNYLSLNNVANLKIVTGDTYLSDKNQTIVTGLSTVLGFQLTLHENVGTSTNLGAIAYWTQSSGGTVTVTPRSTGNGAYLTGHTFNWVAIGY